MDCNLPSSSVHGILQERKLEWVAMQSMHESGWYMTRDGFPGSSDSKMSVCNAGDPGLIPGSGRSPGEGNGNPLQYFCQENPKDKRVMTPLTYWRASFLKPFSFETFTVLTKQKS